ncbi:MAG: ATP-grasp domain-containing protein [Paenibacillus macerans]|nr:ATP-grasp domain-containing protein [Paenibacillus macerans]
MGGVALRGAQSQNLQNRLIMSKAEEMGIGCRQLIAGCEDFLELTCQGRSIVINKTRSHRLPLIAGLLAKNKEAANHLLQRRGLPVPPFIVVPEMGEKAARFLEASASVVVKPLDASGSTGVTLDVRTREQLVEAIRRAGRSSGSILVQRFVPGADYRVLVIGGKVAAVTGYRPAYVIGNGSSSVRELIRRLNETRIRRRSIGEMEAFAEIKADSPRLKAVLDKQGAALDDLIPAGARLELFDLHNAPAGEISEIYADRTDSICPANAEMAIEAARTLQIDVAGIDMRCPDIGRPITKTSGGILEVNALPDFAYHVFSYEGASCDVTRMYLEYLFETTLSASHN